MLYACEEKLELLEQLHLKSLKYILKVKMTLAVTRWTGSFNDDQKKTGRFVG